MLFKKVVFNPLACAECTCHSDALNTATSGYMVTRFVRFCGYTVTRLHGYKCPMGALCVHGYKCPMGHGARASCYPLGAIDAVALGAGVCGARVPWSLGFAPRGGGGADESGVTAAVAPREIFYFLHHRTHWVSYSPATHELQTCDSINALWKINPQAQLSQQAHNSKIKIPLNYQSGSTRLYQLSQAPISPQPLTPFPPPESRTAKSCTCNSRACLTVCLKKWPRVDRLPTS